MSSKAMSLKGRIKNYAKKNNIAAQVVLRSDNKNGFFYFIYFSKNPVIDGISKIRVDE